MNVGQCSELQKLEMYSAGLLSDNERFAIENHLLDCEICSDYVEGLSLISNSINIDNAENEIKEHIHKILYPEKKRFIGSVFYKRMAVAASVLILITASIFVYYHHNLSTKQIAEQVKPITNKPFDEKKTDSSVIKIVAQVSDNKNIKKRKTTFGMAANKSEMLANEFMPSTDTYNKLEDTNRTLETKLAISSPSPIINDIALSIQNNVSTINGIVTDETGEPLPGVTVCIKGTTKGTTSDLNGQFSIPLSAKDSIINLSFIGYITETVAVTGKNDLKLALHPELLALDEVVVIGYGVQKKSMVTGAIASVFSNRELHISDNERNKIESENEDLKNEVAIPTQQFNIYKQLAINYLKLQQYNLVIENLNKLQTICQNIETQRDIKGAIMLLENKEYKKALRKIKKLEQ